MEEAGIWLDFLDKRSKNVNVQYVKNDAKFEIS